MPNVRWLSSSLRPRAKGSGLDDLRGDLIGGLLEAVASAVLGTASGSRDLASAGRITAKIA